MIGNTLKRSERAWLDNFMRNAPPERIRDLLVEINDHLSSQHTWIFEWPLTDLSENIQDVEDAIFDWENP